MKGNAIVFEFIFMLLMCLSPTSHLGLVMLSLLLSSAHLLVCLKKNNNKNVAVNITKVCTMCFHVYSGL